MSAKRPASQRAQIDPVRVGETIRALRRQRHLQQGELAALAGMQAAPLCNIENGKNLPSVRSLCRLAAALEVSVNDLLSPADYLSAEPPRKSSGRIKTGHPFDELARRDIARVTRIAGETRALTPDVLQRIQTRILDYLALEDLAGACKRATLPLRLPFTEDAAGAALLAACVRMHLGIGAAIVFDYVELLENHGLRLLFLDLPEQVESLSFHDAANANAFLVLGEGFNPEKQLFRMFVELANLYLFAENGNLPVQETGETRRFTKWFSSFLLMPEEAVRATVRQLGVAPDAWSFDLLLRIKHRFGVSAETFALRLEEVGALTPKLQQKFKARIQAHYAATHFGEPGDSHRTLSRNGRFGDLLLCARRRSPASPELEGIAARAARKGRCGR